MKKALVILTMGLCTTVWGDTLAPVAGSLNETGYSSTSTSYVNALSVSVNMPYAGNALVFSTFSCESGAATGMTGAWRLAQGSNYSQEVQRYLSGTNDTGIASTVNVFTGLSSGSNSIILQQKAGTNKNLTTLGANMVVVPLVTSGGSALNYGLDTLNSTGTSNSSSSYVASGLSTSVTVDRNDGGIFLAASFNTKSSGSAVTGTWKMQYRVSGGTWQDVGNVTERYMSGTNDTGAATLYAMAEDVDAGTYEVQVLFKSDGTNSITTLNGTLASVALSYDDVNGSGYFPTLAATSDGGTHTGSVFEPIPGATDDIQVEGSGSVVAAMSFSNHVANTGTGTGFFDLQLQLDGSPVADTQEDKRYLSAIADIGSGGAAGLFTGLSEDVYTVKGRYDDNGNDVVADNISLAGFSTGSVPEPATMALLAVGGITLLIAKSKKKKLV